MKKMRMVMRSQGGQGMTEYIIIVALLAIACIGVVTIYGDNLRKMFGASTNALAGSATASTGAKKGHVSHRTVTNFAEFATVS